MTDSFEVVKVHIPNESGSAATFYHSIPFKQSLTKGKVYQVQLFNSDASAHNSVNGQSSHRLSIKRVK
ncbi:MAG: hypothetical protein WDM77_09885 [Steroidobacteraceae bacterium]